MIEFLVAAPASGSGKTIMTCALLSLLKQSGRSPCALKCGPDYIDPMFHRAVLGVKSCNLDLFLSDEKTVQALYARHTAGHDAAVCEGAMGFYDGVGGITDRASAWHVTDTLDVPVLLVLRPKGASLSLAAQVKGLCAFRQNSHLAGILLNECSQMLYKSLAPMLEAETGLPVLGYLPHCGDAVLESRHLGLYTANEITGLAQRMERLAQTAAQTIDLQRLILVCNRERGENAAGALQKATPKARIAVAQDEAFCFTYAETLDALRIPGAEIVPFSPLRDGALPKQIGGLYLPGGYPELYAQQLSQNKKMRAAICAAVSGGLPTVAECGGFLYLGHSLQDAQGAAWPMAGALPGKAFKTDRLVRFGYAELTAQTDSLLLKAGENVPVHEFHYWDSTENGTAFEMKKPVNKRAWTCGFASETLYAAFPHLYFAGRPVLAQRFVNAAAKFRK